MAIGLINTVPRSSCGKCVKVLKELISGLQDDVRDSDGNDGKTRTKTNTISKSYEPPPLTLLRAIARSSQDHRWHDKWGQERMVKLDRDRDNWYKQQQQQKQEHHHQQEQTDSGNDKTNADSIADSISDAVSNNANSNSHNVHDRRSLFPGEVRRQHKHHYQHQHQQHPVMTIEETEDGVKLTIPVETTAPAFMKKWTELEQQQQARARASEGKHQGEHNETSNDDEFEYDYEAGGGGGGGILEDWIPLATSVRRDEDDEHSSLSGVSSSLSDATEAEDPHAAAAVVTNPLTIELKCRRCETSGPEAGARAFLMGPQPLSIVLCHNRIDSDTAEVEEILTHELVHLYDVQTLQLDLSDCETVAYSEVRAAREAECYRSVRDAKAEYEAASASASSGLQAVTTQISETLQTRVYKPYCVRNIALGATQNMFPNEGKACLNKVWDTAYGDHRPFARHHEAQQTQTQTQQHNGSSNGISHEINSGTIHGTSDK